MFTEDCPARQLRERYIPIDRVEQVCHITEQQCTQLIESRKIKYAEFRKPGDHFRSIFIDPIELHQYLEKNHI